MGMDGFSILNTVTQMQRSGVSDLMPSVDLASAGVRLTDISGSVMAESAPIASTGTNVKDLPQSPADPRFRLRIPPPSCAKCGNDHRPNLSYDHQYDDGSAKEAAPVIEAPVVVNGAAYPSQLPSPPARRVAIYDSRTGYIIKVEEAPDWDDVAKIKMDKATLAAVLPLLRALKVRVKNNSEDDFDELAEDRPNPPARFSPSGPSFEEGCRQLGLDPAKVRAAGIVGDVGAGADGFADAQDSQSGDRAEDQG